MNTNEPIEKNLTRLAKTVSLRAAEKAEGREALRVYMAQTRMPAHSPFKWLHTPSMRYMSAFMLLMVISGTGAVSAAEVARPGDVLYGVKLRVTEPARSALIFDKEEKTQFEIERMDRRLKEFSIATLKSPNKETTALIKESLSGSIEQVSRDISELSASGEADKALSANTDMKSVLSAHSRVLRKVSERSPQSAEDIASISLSVDLGIAASENAEQGIEEALDPSLEDDTSVEEQEAETEGSLTGVFSQLLEEAATIDTEDRAEIDESLSYIYETIEEAREARDEGSRKEAYLLYIEAKEQLDSLITLVEADRDLGIGVIDSDAPSSN